MKNSVKYSFLFPWLILMAGALMLYSCRQSSTLFLLKDADETGIHFNNLVQENDSINPIDLEFLYNGGGVAVADFNNDGLSDLYFTASTVSNKLYLNRGKFQFEDVTGTAGVTGEGRWSNGVSVIDINHDGWMDIYVCASILKRSTNRANLLYINQGLNAKGIPVFKEMAGAYNLADTGYSVQAAFFDFDNDSDLDVYLLTTEPVERNGTRFDGGEMLQLERAPRSDRLYRNEGSDSLGHPYFTDVSISAGIKDIGYGLGVSIADFNEDGWKDIYVTNDFFGSDLLYFNNGNGSFTDRAAQCFKHTSTNAMGNDVADINNDGLPDIVAVDMNPEDNFRKKKNMGASNYFIYQSMLDRGLVLQYVRNTLQVNNGLVVTDSMKIPLPVFSDIAFYAGVAETDWSWSPLLADFDNDGLRDLIITNGYPKDVTDHDFGVYRAKAFATATKKEICSQIPEIRIHNYAFRNQGDFRFENVTDAWGMQEPSFSNGAVYADLDNDGDLDYVVNNINQQAFVFENRLSGQNYLDIKFNLPHSPNRHALGARVCIYYGNNKKQVFENFPFRGYLSTTEAKAHFGLGSTSIVDSVLIEWPDRKKQLLKNIKVNQTIEINAADTFTEINKPGTCQALFTEANQSTGIQHLHEELDYIDFTAEKLLPHKLSQYGPALAVADINGDGLDDLFCGASAGFDGRLFVQNEYGRFESKELSSTGFYNDRRPEMMGALFFDADQDGDEDLYIASGSNEFKANTLNYQDRFFQNDGKGNFKLDTNAFPHNYTSKSCVKAADIDNDGDLDLLVGGRVLPGSYPEAVSSVLYRNDSDSGTVRFTDVTRELAPALIACGLICDALFTDFDNDGWTDLLLAGEWMPITVLRNNKGLFENNTNKSGLENKIGWWNSITGGDFDNDGDMDYVAGNLGTNSFYRATEKEPASIYYGYIDEDGSFDAVPAIFLTGKDGKRRSFTSHNRDDLIKQMLVVRRKFLSYKDFAVADIVQVLENNLPKAKKLEANYFSSALLINQGNGRFECKALPAPAQWSPLNGMLAEDFDKDGNLDIALVGNDYGTETSTGRYDALNGLLLRGNGNDSFSVMSLQQSGLFVPGDAKALLMLGNRGNRLWLVASQNRSSLKVFTPVTSPSFFKAGKNDRYAIVEFKNGNRRRQEFYHGSSFLSQSANIILYNNHIKQVRVFGQSSVERILTP